MIQKQIDVKDTARLIFITHETKNASLYDSIKEIKKLDAVKKIINIIRVEELD
jgi:hypothetical protein